MKIPKTIKSRWVGNRERCRLHELSKQFGDGKKLVLLSFYSAPELAIVVKFNSDIPLELPDHERFKPKPPPSFRDHLDAIYDACEEQFETPPVSRYRRKELERECHEDETLWSVIINAGSTWCLL